ncbi:MAG: hypothetical protein QNJ71_08870 [Acidimicrobiia bacterium]|nr:hypothetical protein [Acidimicrobiia bacterium]
MLHLEINVKRRHIYALVLAIALIITIIPVSSWAAHQFNDVPNSNIFHDDIGWLADNGITLGCNPPDNDEFCPTDNVRRETMAAFMRRLAVNQVVDAKTAIDAQNADNADMLDGYEATDLMPGGVVPAGATIRGVWSVGGASATWVNDGHSFGYTLPSKPVSHYISGGPTTECPGTATQPEALPGHLCVYEDTRNGISVDLTVGDADGQRTLASTFGFFVTTETAGAANMLAYGGWAVTAAEATPATSGSTGSGDIGR